MTDRQTFVSWPLVQDKLVKPALDFNKPGNDGVAVAWAGSRANHLHLTPARQPCQHIVTHFLQAGCYCSSWHPTNSVKIL